MGIPCAYAPRLYGREHCRVRAPYFLNHTGTQGAAATRHGLFSDEIEQTRRQDE